ncbi:2'-5' RNA ligase family protein [Marivirga salinae]|uniref:2'-5' RNA ligase family protein n=1 Tax=Marivirga salinarum TaxID=3059078 RepID=A0AA49GCM4_9BACT|nr:2'-5' RNA ligase family protein [Marivirga sp. BDSF4-3]WKK76365.2 2'-5' RNA ligase family protein [Marivirga sp. BDSF4-3]
MEKSMFFIGIGPPHPLEKKIQRIKEEFRQKHGIEGAFRSKAHITLQMPFNLSVNSEKDFIHELKKILIKQKPIELKLNDFGKFEPRVIFIKVDENEELDLLQKSVERFMKRFQVFNGTHKNNGFTPHITVAFRDLKKPTFHKIWDDVKNRTFKENFLADSITVFKHNGKSWDVFEEIKLDPQ